MATFTERLDNTNTNIKNAKAEINSAFLDIGIKDLTDNESFETYANKIKECSYREYTIQERWIDEGLADWVVEDSQVRFHTDVNSVPEVDDGNILTSAENMFKDCTELTEIEFLFDIINIQNMSYMFSGCTSLSTFPLFDYINVTDLSFIFENCTALTYIEYINAINCDNLDGAFNGCTNLTDLFIVNLKADLDLSQCPNLKKECIQYIIDNAQTVDNKTLTLANVEEFTYEDVEEFYSKGWSTIPMIADDGIQGLWIDTGLAYWVDEDTKDQVKFNTDVVEIPAVRDAWRLKSCLQMCHNCAQLTTVPDLDLINCTNTQQMFQNCTSLTTVGTINIPEVTITTNMFSGCTSLNYPPITYMPKVITANSMYENMNLGDLSEVTFEMPEVESLQGFIQVETSVAINGVTKAPIILAPKVNNISRLVAGNRQLVDISNLVYLDTSNVTNFSYLFATVIGSSTGTINLDLTPVANWDTSRGNNFSYLCYNNRDIVTAAPLANWKLNGDCSGMFYQASRITTIPEWDMISVTYTANFGTSASSLTSCNLKNLSTSISFQGIPNLPAVTINYMFQNALAIRSNSEVFTLNTTAYNRLTTAQRNVLTNKGWRLVHTNS